MRILAGIALALVVSCGPSEKEPRTSRPSIVFVSIDTLAARHLSLYGYERETSPELDRFAREAVVFQHCVANAPYTTPSYTSQFTGLYTGSLDTGHWEREGGELLRWSIPEGRETLAERLAAAGYRTAAFVDNPLAGARFGLGQGFEVYDESAAEISSLKPGGGMDLVVSLGEGWLEDLRPGEPFFLFLQALDCHAAYTPFAPYAGRFGGDPWSGGEREEAIGGPYRYGVIPDNVAKPVLAEPLPARARTAPFVAAYDEEITAVDAAFGRLLASLESRGLLDDTIIVFTADHGESLLEHDWFFQHGTNYEEVLHVPLVIRLPGGAARRVAASVQLVDLFPTLLELVALPYDADTLHGRSLVTLLNGGTLPPVPILAGPDLHGGWALLHDGWKLVEARPAVGRHHTVLSHPRVRKWLVERHGGTQDLPADQVEAAVARAPDPKKLWEEVTAALAGPYHELYRLDDDPGELVDLAAAEPERVAELARLLARELERAEKARRAVPPGARVVADEELLREMEALGYAGDH